MSDSIESIADEYRRRAYREAVVGATAALALAILALSVGGPVAASAVVLFVTVVVYAPLFAGRRRIELRSEDSPSTVRSAFGGEGCPLVAMERSWSDELEETDGGWAFSYVGGKIFRRDVRYEVERSDDGIEVVVYRNDSLRTTYEVSVDAAEDGEGSRIAIDGRWGSRRHLRSVLLDRVRASYERRIYEELGYEVLDLETERSVL